MLKNVSILFLAIAFSFTFQNCSGPNSVSQIFSASIVDEEEFSKKNSSEISNFLSMTSSIDTGKNQSDFLKTSLQEAYAKLNHHPIWYTSKGLKPAADSLLNQIEFIEKVEGIKIDDIKENIDFITKNKNSEQIDTIVKLDLALSYVYANLCQKILLGNNPPKFSKYYQVINDSLHLIENPLLVLSNANDSFDIWKLYRSLHPDYFPLMEEIHRWNTLSQDNTYTSYKNNVSSQLSDSALLYIIQKETNITIRNSDSTYQVPMDSIIKEFQKFYAIKETGKLDESTIKILKRNPDYYIQKLQLNLERIRWIPRDLGEEYVYVNIPLMEIFYAKENKELFHANVIVGKPGRPTPSINMKMTDIVFNPPWGVPPTILNQDVGPGVARAGGSYLSRKGLRAYDSRGRDVTNQVNGSNYKKFRIAQPPGAGNALGDVKFNMPNAEAIFIHDTPNRGYFKQSNRALSSGCVRTENPKVLAEIILKDKGYTMEKINSVVSTRRTEKVDLDKQIPVFLVYLTTHYDKYTKRVQYLYDVYGKDKL